uniref:Disease resistance RPP13-like protein 1 n=2 Tax=Vitis vinifera TaxID=29760 RepID=A5C9R4_VITVI|nr:hypothetical protein VITISV_017849 [Vitis vinifera]
MDADLKGKHNIKDLTMEWGNDFYDTRNDKNEMQLYLKGCRNCTLLPSLGQLSWIKNLCIEGMSGIKNIDVEFYGQNVESFQSLESLTFSDMLEWEEWRSPSFIDEERLFPRLHELKMTECPKLTAPLPKVLFLQDLKLKACNEVVLGRIGVDFNSLAALEIGDYEEVRWLRLEKLGGLKRLKVCRCDGLVSLEEPTLPCNLEYLEIRECTNLEKLPNELQSLRSATELVIGNCPKLMNILEKGWPPMLRKLEVFNCEGIKALPGYYAQLQSRAVEYPGMFISDLISKWWMSESRGISGRGLGLGFAPNLRYVAIVNCENLKTPLSGWGLNWLSSLKVLIIAPGGYQNVISFSHDDDDCHLRFPTFLTRLNIGNFQNLESMASLPLPTLVSLQRLYIWDCPKLQLFLPKEGLPETLGRLQIRGCSIIEKRCLKGRGEDWPHTAHIPVIKIGRN